MRLRMTMAEATAPVPAGQALRVARLRTAAMIGRMPQQDTPMAVDAPEIVEVDDTRVACDGDDGSLGHPRLYLEMGDATFVECPYCDRRFVLRAGAHPH